MTLFLKFFGNNFSYDKCFLDLKIVSVRSLNQWHSTQTCPKRGLKHGLCTLNVFPMTQLYINTSLHYLSLHQMIAVAVIEIRAFVIRIRIRIKAKYRQRLIRYGILQRQTQRPLSEFICRAHPKVSEIPYYIFAAPHLCCAIFTICTAKVSHSNDVIRYSTTVIQLRKYYFSSLFH